MGNETFLYFAYGSNLWSERIHENNKSATMKSVALLQGYRLEFANMTHRWRGASANILQDPESHVYGVLWEIKLPDLEYLDRQEGVMDNVYKRINLTVQTLDGEDIDCMAYELQSETRDKSIKKYGDELKPSLKYKNVIIRGAKEHKLPQEYISFLENIPDNGYNAEVDVNIPIN